MDICNRLPQEKPRGAQLVGIGVIDVKEEGYQDRRCGICLAVVVPLPEPEALGDELRRGFRVWCWRTILCQSELTDRGRAEGGSECECLGIWVRSAEMLQEVLGADDWPYSESLLVEDIDKMAVIVHDNWVRMRGRDG